jgi:hypothetical protein
MRKRPAMVLPDMAMHGSASRTKRSSPVYCSHTRFHLKASRRFKEDTGARNGAASWITASIPAVLPDRTSWRRGVQNRVADAGPETRSCRELQLSSSGTSNFVPGAFRVFGRPPATFRRRGLGESIRVRRCAPLIGPLGAGLDMSDWPRTVSDRDWRHPAGCAPI